MAENEKIVNQSNSANNNNTSTYPTTTFVPPPPPRLVDQEGRTESDATHIRLRDDRHPTSLITCLSCGEIFASTSLLQVYEHYSERTHPRYYGSCLYCGGKVHQYCHAHTPQVRIYHNCLRSKRGDDK